MRGKDGRLALPAHLTTSEREFHAELRRLVDASGLSARELGDMAADETLWEGWLDGQSVPPLRVVRKLAAKLAPEGVDAGRLVGLWARAFLPTPYPAEPGRTPGRPQQLPLATRHFMGRAAEIKALDDLARQVAADADAGRGTGNGSPVVAVIEGPGGVGKTTLVNHVAHRVKSLFPDGQLYVNMRGFGDATEPLTDGQALRGFLEAFGVPSRELPATADDKAALYRSLLAGRRVLVVLDNARDVAQVRRLIPDSPGCLLLITTRALASGLAGAGAHVLPLGPFSDGEARDLLERSLGAARLQSEPQAAEELTGLCGRLPMALRIAAARAASDTGLRLEELTRELRSLGLDGDESADPAVTVRTVLEASCEHLSEDAARMFRMFGACPEPDVSPLAAASLAAVPAEQARAALDELAAARLAEEHEPGRFSVHDLLHAYATDLALTSDGTAALDTATRRLLDYYLRSMLAAKTRIFPGQSPSPLTQPVAGVQAERFGSRAQALAWYRAERQAALSLITYAARRGGFDVYCWRLPWAMSQLLARGGFLHDYLTAQRIAITAAGNLGDTFGQGIAHYELAHACALLGEVSECDAHLKEALRWFTKAEDKAAAARTINAMAQLLTQEGKYQQALERGQEALELRRALGDTYAIAHSEETLGSIYAQLGRHAEAVRYCQHSLDLSREIGSRALAADALATLGFVHLSLADHDKAVACYMEVLAIYREIGDSPGTAGALTGLGDAQHAKGDNTAARAAWRQAQAILADLPNADVQQVRARLAQLP